MSQWGVARNDPTILRFKIPSGQQNSTSLQAPGASGARIENPHMTLVALVVPAGFSGTGVSFSVSLDGVNYFPVYQADGNPYAATVAASQWVVLPPSVTFGWQWIKLVAGTAQGADANIDAIFMVV